MAVGYPNCWLSNCRKFRSCRSFIHRVWSARSSNNNDNMLDYQNVSDSFSLAFIALGRHHFAYKLVIRDCYGLNIYTRLYDFGYRICVCVFFFLSGASWQTAIAYLKFRPIIVCPKISVFWKFFFLRKTFLVRSLIVQLLMWNSVWRGSLRPKSFESSGHQVEFEQQQ